MYTSLFQRVSIYRGPILHACRLVHSTSSLPIPPELKTLETSQDMEKARSWMDQFRGTSIPRKYVDLQFSRSSGPGGQNVNKVNTKASVRCSLNSPWIPAWARSALLDSSYYVASSHSLHVSSTTTRSQAQNVEDCLAKLHTIILAAATAPIKNEPSEEQKKKVEKFKHAENARRKAEKTYRSEVKRSRSSKDWF